MNTISRSVLALACFVCALPLRALPAAASARQDQPKGNQAPHIDCLVCGERSYTFPSGAPVDKDGNMIVWCAHCKRDTAHRSNVNQSPGLPAPPDSKSEGRGGLRLRRPDPPTETQKSDSDPAPAQAGDAPQAEAHPSPAAAFVFQQVRKLKGVDDRLIEPSVNSLCAMGDQGLLAARGELASMEPQVLVVAARVLLRTPQPADVELVQRRLRAKLPVLGAPAVLQALVAADPVHAGPRFLVEMLDSPNAALRTQAARELRPQLAQAGVAVLQPAFDSRRSETRLEAVALACGLPDPAVTDVLLAHLADPAPHVAARVIAELAGRKDDTLEAKLLSSAFHERWILRTEAYSLLALMEREDVGARAILDETQVEPLLSGMESNDPFIAGTCACALAGIGFRSLKVRDASWLDRDVVDRLVGVVSGKVFHNDFSSLQNPAMRRLQLLTGQDAGNDGSRWVAWWIEARTGFHALRAWIPYEEKELARLALKISDGNSRWRLIGPELSWPIDLAPQEDAFFLSATQARDLAHTLETEGVFGPQRLPGARGTRGTGERSAEISVAGRGKVFVFGPDVQEPWFDRILAASRALAEHNRWELFPVPGRHLNAGELWAEQSAWWSAEHSEHERELRLKELVLATVAARQAPNRERALTELERLYALPGIPDATDFRTFLEALGGTAPPATVPGLIRMAIAAARSVAPQDPKIPIEPAHELVHVVLERPDSIESALPAVLEAAGPAFTREMLADARPAVRAAAAHVMAEFPDADPVTALLPMLSDKVVDVQSAAIQSLGELRAESARTELLVRARLGVKPVRMAALRAVGKLRGDFVLDALLLALSDGDPDLRLAAVDGMAELEDPASAPFLVSLLGDPSLPALHDAARKGLLRLRDRAWPELRRALLGATPSGKLEAAFVLSEQCVAEAVPILLGALTANPRDGHIGSELTILTGVDLRAQDDPATHWWTWWDGVVHDDSIAWLRAALERLQLTPPAAETLAGKGTYAGRAYLMHLVDRPETWLAERARRELARMLSIEIAPAPPLGKARDAWKAGIAAEIEKHRDP